MIDIFKSRNFSGLFGYSLFIGMMAAGYYYNLTFVQLGLEDFGANLLGLSAVAIIEGRVTSRAGIPLPDLPKQSAPSAHQNAQL